MNKFSLIVLAAERPFYEGQCVSLVIPAIDGQYGIMANHSNLITAIAPGTLKITEPDGDVIVAAVSQGIAKIEENTVLLLVDSIELPEEIDENRARRVLEQAKEEMLQKKSIQDYHAAQARMARAINRLRVKKYDNIH